MKNFVFGMVVGMAVLDLGMKMIMNNDEAWERFVETREVMKDHRDRANLSRGA